MQENHVTSSLDDMARQERLAYYKNWRAQNKDRVKKHNHAYWEKRALKRQTEKNALVQGVDTNVTNDSNDK